MNRVSRRTALVAEVSISLLATAAGAVPLARPTPPDESPFVEGLRPDQPETLLYVWTRDADGKDSDFLSVVDADPASETFGSIIATTPTGSARNEAHHFGYTEDAGRIFAGGLFSNRLFIYDVETDPRSPRLVRTVDLDPTGYHGPHTLYAVPGGVMLSMLGRVDGGGPAALVKVDRDGRFVEAWPARGTDVPEFMYDVGVKPEMNRMLTSSWAHPHDITTMGGVPEEDVGDEVVVWDWKAKRVLEVEHLDPVMLEIRWLHGPQGRGGFVNSGYGDSMWYWEDDDDGDLEFHRVISFAEGASPADLRISYDNRWLYVSLWGGDEVQQFDIRDPLHPVLTASVSIPQPNMMKLSADSRRLYVTNSLLSTLDGDVEFGAWQLDVGPEGIAINPRFHPDFEGMPSGPAGPHDMLLR
jgi:selenium-binding protein 1